VQTAREQRKQITHARFVAKSVWGMCTVRQAGRQAGRQARREGGDGGPSPRKEGRNCSCFPLVVFSQVGKASKQASLVVPTHHHW
jgi:hypothetical protein